MDAPTLLVAIVCGLVIVALGAFIAACRTLIAMVKAFLIR